MKSRLPKTKIAEIFISIAYTYIYQEPKNYIYNTRSRDDFIHSSAPSIGPKCGAAVRAWLKNKNPEGVAPSARVCRTKPQETPASTHPLPTDFIYT